MSRFWPHALLLVGLLPFLGKAYHIDDPVFLTIADHIRHAPTRPYDVTVPLPPSARRVAAAPRVGVPRGKATGGAAVARGVLCPI